MKRNKPIFILLLLILSLSLVLIFSSCQNSNEQDSPPVGEDQTDNEAEALPDGEKIFYREGNDIEKIVMYRDGKAVWIREYDTDGNYARYTEYTETGHFVCDKLIGNVNEKISYYGKDGALIESVSYEYHENGVLLKETVRSASGDIKGIFEYDESGTMVQAHRYEMLDGRYVLCEIIDYVYADDGHSDKDIFYRSDGSILAIHEYNSNGDITQKTCYGENGEISFYTVYEYDGSLKKLSETQYGASGNPLSACQYGQDGKKTRLTNFFENGSPSLTYEYGDDGNVKRLSRFDELGLVSSIEEYGENGDLVRFTAYNDDRSALIYDGSFNIIEGTRYLRYANGGFTKYEYKSGIVRSETICYDGVNVSYFFKYDESSFLLEACTYKGGRLELRTLYSRDDRGDIISFTEHETNGSVLVYDANGNLVSGVRYQYFKEGLRVKHEYENGIKIKETVYSENRISLVSDYDENEVLRKETFYSDGKVSRIKEYDTNGVLRKETVYNSKGRIESVTTYDEKGNKI